MVGFPGVEITVTLRSPCTPSSGICHPSTREPAPVVSAGVAGVESGVTCCEPVAAPSIFMMFFGESWVAS